MGRNATTILDLESQTQALKARPAALHETIADRKATADNLNEQLSKALRQIVEMEGGLHEGERIRATLPNAVQELKGIIRVFCRLRPIPNPANGLDLECGQKTAEDQQELVLRQQEEAAHGGAIVKAFPFSFDRVFGPASTQTEVFAEIGQLV